ncbi:MULTISPECIES: YdcF family protein [unclassified Arcicella]|uniref:YdcF family protein n=1 Tax=unclassified Arcicella TaxID=2644986 RepID=UPI00285D929B|nr:MULTISPECIES: YdcF family protein [unclassified Arcicella]MDR6561956.1 hypothetical protein [Arcicella sp. BE51]MDR6811827.1 hypothetical protein [Arcicella sp. BE140]MDR6822857.1 hypothetical protein [Arcicella sp. BE139]
MKKIYSLVFCGLLFCSFHALKAQNAKANYTLMHGKSFVQSKNYYLLTLFQNLPEVKQLLSKDASLQKITQQKLKGLSEASKECQNKFLCLSESMKLSEADIQEVSRRLGELYNDNNALGKLVFNHLIPSGAYILSQKLSAKEQLIKAWEQDAHGINFAIGVYIEGQKANYPAIDSISFKVSNKNYSQLVGDLHTTVQEESKKVTLFFEPSLTSALLALEINEREQVADYEPMASTVNKLAFERIKTINWKAYKYAVILVPGAGPDEPKVALSAEGMLRCRVAALRYFEGLAPLVVVSGGNVHPYKTPYNEAIEMRKFMVEKLHVPANAVIVEPHARHTTTNMRNTARLIFRYGIPFDKACITSTSKSQSMYIQELNLDKRCEKELNHVPYRKGKRLSETEAEFYPLIEALQINPLEPLDP